MPVYEYTALNAKGKKVSGIIDADGAMAARSKLRNTGIYPVSVLEAQKTSIKKDSGRPSLRNLFTRVSPNEIAMVTRQLSTLVGAGLPLVSAFDTMIPQIKTKALKKMLAQVKESITEGNSFAASLTAFSGTFTPLYINMVHSGEASGTLEIVLERLAEITEKQEAFKSRIRTALAYPILMSFIGVVVLFFLMTYIVPNITVIFTDMNQALPPPTRLLISLSDLMKTYGWLILGLFLGAIVAFRSAKKTDKGRRFFDSLSLKLPFTGLLARKLAAARFSRTLGSLLENGVPMMQALGIVKNIVGNGVISEAVEAAGKEVEKGKTLGNSLGAFEIFPNLCIQMIQVGEQSGELEKMLSKVAGVYEQDVESTIMRMTALLEPLMILVMGVMVGFIVLSICLPIFEMNQLVR
jgi:general secretion pathway protein F